jgi:hypothetical protein
LRSSGADPPPKPLPHLEDTVNFLAVTLLGFKFSGTFALVAVVIIAVVIGVVWYLATQRH